MGVIVKATIAGTKVEYSVDQVKKEPQRITCAYALSALGMLVESRKVARLASRPKRDLVRRWAYGGKSNYAAKVSEMVRGVESALESMTSVCPYKEFDEPVSVMKNTIHAVQRRLAESI